MESEVRRGVIRSFRGSRGSGLGSLEIEDTEHGLMRVACENGPTVRALEACFGDVIGDAHDVKTDGGHVGRDVYYSVAGYGVLEGFMPVEEASPELVEAHEARQAALAGEEGE